MVPLEFFIDIIRTIALGSTKPLREMSTRVISWGGKGGRCVGLTTLPPSPADCLEIWEPQLPGTLGACPEFIAVVVPLLFFLLYKFLIPKRNQQAGERFCFYYGSQDVLW
jgi:hypothetical protein